MAVLFIISNLFTFTVSREKLIIFIFQKPFDVCFPSYSIITGNIQSIIDTRDRNNLSSDISPATI